MSVWRALQYARTATIARLIPATIIRAGSSLSLTSNAKVTNLSLQLTFNHFNKSLPRVVCYSQWGSTKKHRKVKLQLFLDTMADPQHEEILAPLRANVKEQVSIFSLITNIN